MCEIEFIRHKTLTVEDQEEALQNHTSNLLMLVVQ